MGPNFICNINMSFIFIPSPQALEAHRLILIIGSSGSLMGPNFHLQHQHVFHLIPSPPQALEAHRLISSLAHQVHSWAPTVICNINMSCRFIFIPSPPRLLRPVGSSSFLPHQVHSWAPTFICSINMSFIFTPRPRSLKIFREGRGTHQAAVLYYTITRLDHQCKRLTPKTPSRRRSRRTSSPCRLTKPHRCLRLQLHNA